MAVYLIHEARWVEVVDVKDVGPPILGAGFGVLERPPEGALTHPRLDVHPDERRDQNGWCQTV